MISTFFRHAFMFFQLFELESLLNSTDNTINLNPRYGRTMHILIISILLKSIYQFTDYFGLNYFYFGLN